MGIYINPDGLTKGEWLLNNAAPISLENLKIRPGSGWVPLVFVTSGRINVIAVIHSADELRDFTLEEDTRPKCFWEAPFQNVSREVHVTELPLIQHLQKE